MSLTRNFNYMFSLHLFNKLNNFILVTVGINGSTDIAKSRIIHEGGKTIETIHVPPTPTTPYVAPTICRVKNHVVFGQQLQVLQLANF